MMMVERRFVELPELLSAREVSDITGLPVSTLHDYAVRREAGEPVNAPVHVNLGPRRRRWRLSDVEAWFKECGVD